MNKQKTAQIGAISAVPPAYVIREIVGGVSSRSERKRILKI